MIIIKIRSSFVTNSSSSSFILAFKNQKKLDEFYEECDYSDYQEFADLIKHFSKESRSKEEIIDMLYRFYSFEYEDELFNDYIKDKDIYWTEQYNLKTKIRKEQWFIDNVNSYIVNHTDYLEKKKQIEESEIVIDGMIWDTSGGVLEWAIRNGFIEENFSGNCVICYNVG